MNDVLKGVLGSLIAAALIAAGTWLSITQVPEKTVLNYIVQQHKTKDLVTWHLSFINYSEITFDEISIDAPRNSLLAASFDPPSKILLPKEDAQKKWKGKLLRGERVTALFVFESGSMIFNESLLQGLISANYQERDNATGDWVTRNVPLVFGETPTFNRAIKKLIWFLLPFFSVGAFSFVGLYLYRKNFSTAIARPEGEAVGDEDAEQPHTL